MSALRRVARLELVRPESASDEAEWRATTARYRGMSPAELDDLIRAGFEADGGPTWDMMTADEVDEALLGEMAGFAGRRA